MSATETSRQSTWLCRLATALEPARLPFYVRTPDEPGVLAGWYWQPADATEPVPLGSNVFLAQIALERIRRQAGL